MFLTFDTVEAFAVKRNPNISFPFLKENGELLMITINSGYLIEPRALRLYDDFYRNAFALTKRYPQYYRFTLGMALDLEKGGMIGNEGQKIADYVNKEKFILYDTSDIRRLETLTMLSAIENLSSENRKIYRDILTRIESFIENPAWYTKFNKPNFYDLTHIVFYLTNYGTTALPLMCNVYPCLMNIGALALLDKDADLLSEVCLCLSYIGRDIPLYWASYLENYLEEIEISYSGSVASALNPSVDEYHIYLMLNAYLASREKPTFQEKFKSRTPNFQLPDARPSVLAKLSHFAHAYTFQSKRKQNSIESFISTLDETEFNHWQQSINSTSSGQNLVQAFSGLN